MVFPTSRDGVASVLLLMAWLLCGVTAANSLVMMEVAGRRKAEALRVCHESLTVVPLRTVTRARAQLPGLLHLVQNGQRVVAPLRAL